MNKIIMTIAGVCAFTASVMLSSCDFLDVDNYFQATFKEDSIFHSKRNAEGYLWNTPQDFLNEDAIWGGSWYPGETASDEIAIKWRTNEFWGSQFTVGNINETNVPNWDVWKKMFIVIQRCNKMFANVDNVPDMTDGDRLEYKAYAHFMRGWAYYHLLVNWGPLLIVGDEVIPTYKENEYYNRERATFDESIDYICNEFALSLKGLSEPQDQSITFFQRPTKGAALALIARLRLWQASPTFNGGESARKCFGGWKRKSDGVDYVNQKYDANRWAVAAAAAKQVIDLNYYELHTVKSDAEHPYPLDHVDDALKSKNFPDGVGGIDPYHSFADMFNGEGVAVVNKEFIWAKQYAFSLIDYTKHCFPVGNSLGGWGGMSVPQRVIDCFLMADGKLPSKSALYEPDFEQTTDKAQQLSSYVLKNGVPKAFANRSARFYASIGFPGRVWEMNTASEKSEFTNKQFWYDASDAIAGKAGAQNNPNDVNITGYTSVKYIHPDDSWCTKVDAAARTFKPYATIRYAEVLLEFCEAMNNIEGNPTIKTWDKSGQEIEVAIDRNEQLMAKYFNMIRYRVGLPGVELSVLQNREAFEKVIRNERQVELFNEGYRYFDTRRWGTYLEEDANSSNWRGLDVSKDRDDTNNNGGFWNIVQIDEQNYRDRIAKPKMIFLPLSHDQLLITPKMDQNWGWDR